VCGPHDRWRGSSSPVRWARIILYSHVWLHTNLFGLRQPLWNIWFCGLEPYSGKLPQFSRHMRNTQFRGPIKLSILPYDSSSEPPLGTDCGGRQRLFTLQRSLARLASLAALRSLVASGQWQSQKTNRCPEVYSRPERQQLVGVFY
jgi:hypothetical protein